MLKATRRRQHAFSRDIGPSAAVLLTALLHSVSAGGCGRAGTTTKPSPPGLPAPQGGGFSQVCANPHYPPNSAPTTIDATPCTVAGNDGAETSQNEAKNNFCAHDPARPITVSAMANLQAQVQQNSSIPFGNPNEHPLTSKPGPAQDRKPLQALGEGTAVILQGFVLVARQEGAESVNCGDNLANIDTNHDIHVIIVDSASQQDECSGVVVEMIPHHRPATWTEQNVTKVANKKLPVRVTGQLFFDSSHSPCQKGTSVPGDPKRISLWEVHPLYEFDVCPQGGCSNGNGWVTLEEFLKE